MAVVTPTAITCTRCGETYRSHEHVLGVTRAAELRPAILDGTLHTHRCPRCGEATARERGLVYADLDRGQLVLCRPRAELPRWRAAERQVERLFEGEIRGAAAESVRARADDFVVRVVFGYAWLREKLLLWDAGLDDRVFEGVKLRLLQQQPMLLGAGRFDMVLDTLDDTRFAVMVLPNGSGDAQRYVIERSVYAIAERDMAAAEAPTGAFVDLRRAALG